jgi:D-alanyl-D-alanine carboxypeptidase (penicillin-binding protein 5/6)
MIQNYPEFYSYYKETTFTWDRTGGDPITQGNRNPLLYKKIGADGIKTGFLTVEQYSLAASVKTGSRRINSVGSGFVTKNKRSSESAKMIRWALRNFDTVSVTKKNVKFKNIDIWLGKKNSVAVSTNQDVYLTIPKRKKKNINAVVKYYSPIKAPIEKGDKVGKLSIYISGELKKEFDLFSNETIERANIISRLFKSLNFLVWGDV